MKSVLYLAAILFIFSQFNPNLHAQNKVLIKNIEYDVSIINKDLCQGSELSETGWWKRNIETSKRWYFQQAVLNKAIDGKIKVYDEKGNELSHESLMDLVSYKDTAILSRTHPPYDVYDTVIVKFISPADIHSIRFRETWYYDQATFKITKEINGYSPVIAVDKEVKVKSQIRYITVDKPLFWVKPEANRDKNNFTEFTDFILYNCPVYKNMDVMMPQFGNLVSTSSDTLSRKNYIDSLLSAVSSGKITPNLTTDFNDYYDFTIDSMIPLSKYELFYIINMPDTTTDPYGQYHDTVLYKSLPAESISMFRFYEKWLLDPSTMEFKKEVMAFSPCEIVYNEKGGFKGIKPLFCVMFEKPIRCFIE